MPFRDADGRIFIVDRGWVPPGDGMPRIRCRPLPRGKPRSRCDFARASSYRHRVAGAPEGQVPTINLPSIATLVDGDVITSAYGRVISEEPAGDGALGGFDSPTDDPGPHLSYAIQWILFALMGFIFIGYIIRTEIVKHREEVEGTPAPVRKSRRKDHDADVEDELLDVR